MTEYETARLVKLVALLLVLIPFAVPMLRSHRRRLRLAGAALLAGGIAFGLFRLVLDLLR